MAPIRTRELKDLPLSLSAKDILRSLLRRGHVSGALVYHDRTPDENVRVHAWGPGCFDKTEARALRSIPCEPAWVWAPRDPDTSTKALTGVKPGSKTAEAVRLLKSGEAATPHAAASAVGINPSAVYRALERGARPVCECCGRPT